MAIAANAALAYKLGRVSEKFESSLVAVLKSAHRSKTPVVHREKVAVEDYLKFIDIDKEEENETAALGILMFRGFLRIGEALQLETSELTKDGIEWRIFIRKSKTDQEAIGTLRAFKASPTENAILTVLNAGKPSERTNGTLRMHLEGEEPPVYFYKEFHHGRFRNMAVGQPSRLSMHTSPLL